MYFFPMDFAQTYCKNNIFLEWTPYSILFSSQCNFFKNQSIIQKKNNWTSFQNTIILNNTPLVIKLLL